VREVGTKPEAPCWLCMSVNLPGNW
jgi:hypothetical protein